MRTTKLGQLTVSAQGLGCMAMQQPGHRAPPLGLSPSRPLPRAGPRARSSLAWVYAQADRLGVPLAPIPGTKRVKWLEQNVAVMDITLTADELAILDPLASQVTGARY